MLVPPRPAGLAVDPASRLFSAPPGALAKSRARIVAGDRSLQQALEKLVREADAALRVAPTSVMDKSKAAPSGDKHDYFSTAPYYWPDPTKPNGLPYIRRDGEVNPESAGAASDAGRFLSTAKTAETLALAHYLTGEAKYAVHAALLLRIWFLGPATRMNPNLTYAQAVPGVCDGRSTGMIEAGRLTRLADAAALLAGSPAWPKSDDEALSGWLATFLEWARTSRNGREEAAAKNNHGTCNDILIAHLALFLDRRDLALEVLESAKQRRIASQIRPDGTQPFELARADPFAYSRFNLQALFALATRGEHAGVDLWHHQTAGGASLRSALDFLMRFVEAPELPWPYERGRVESRDLTPLLRPAWAVYADERYFEILRRTPDFDAQRDALFFSR